MGINSQSDKRTITIGDCSIKLPGSVKRVVDIDGLKVILVNSDDFDPPTPQEYNRNIFAFDHHGRLIWRVEVVPWGGDRPKPYTNIWKFDEETLIAYNWIGYEMKVELGTGRVELWQKPGAPYGQRPW